MRISMLNSKARFNFGLFNNNIRKFSTNFPETVDLNVLGRCNLDCKWCWGPEHDMKESVRLPQWQSALQFLVNNGTKNLVISGGEPLLLSWIGNLARFAKENLGMHITLSTNGILLPKRGAGILPYLDEIGIPLDGHTHEYNKVMRVGKYHHFNCALDAMKLVQRHYPKIELTVRTVVASPNIFSVPMIGDTLIENGIYVDEIRWKIYQVNPIGPRKEKTIEEGWLVSDIDFLDTIKTLKERYLNIDIRSQKISDSAGRYFIVFPDGKSHVIQKNIGHTEMVEIPLGDIFSSPNEIVQAFKENPALAIKPISPVKKAQGNSAGFFFGLQKGELQNKSLGNY